MDANLKNDDADKFLTELNKLKRNMEERILKIGQQWLPNETKSVSNYIPHLDKLEMQGILAEAEIKDEVMSYDILQNDRYRGLANLQNLVETYARKDSM